MCQLDRMSDTNALIYKEFPQAMCNGCESIIDQSEIQTYLVDRHSSRTINGKRCLVHVWVREDETYCPACDEDTWYILEFCEDNTQLNGFPESKRVSKNRKIVPVVQLDEH